MTLASAFASPPNQPDDDSFLRGPGGNVVVALIAGLSKTGIALMTLVTLLSRERPHLSFPPSFARHHRGFPGCPAPALRRSRKSPAAFSPMGLAPLRGQSCLHHGGFPMVFRTRFKQAERHLRALGSSSMVGPRRRPDRFCLERPAPESKSPLRESDSDRTNQER